MFSEETTKECNDANLSWKNTLTHRETKSYGCSKDEDNVVLLTLAVHCRTMLCYSLMSLKRKAKADGAKGHDDKW